MNSFARKLSQFFATGIACLSLTAVLSAQVQTQTTVTHEPATTTVQVDRGEVVYVSGNNLVVKKDDGTIVHFPKVSENMRATVDGKQVGIHDLKPGMKLERTITTTSTPRTVKTVETVTGTVWHVNAPNFVILKLQDGSHHQFALPSGQKVMVDGKLTDAWGLRKGMKIEATRAVETPETVVSQQTHIAGTAPKLALAADEPVMFAMLEPITPAPATAAPATLPETASSLPMAGLLGLLAVASALGLKMTRRAL